MSYHRRDESVPANGTPDPDTESGTPTREKLPDGQYKDHWVLSPQERSKGFVRPVRRSYRHVGLSGPTYPLRDLTDDEYDRYKQFRYVKFEDYPPDHETSSLERYWTEEDLNNRGCGVVTTMGPAIAETYATDPGYYGKTFCCGCQEYFKVGRDGEFVWDDGSDERVGT